MDLVSFSLKKQSGLNSLSRQEQKDLERLSQQEKSYLTRLVWRNHHDVRRLTEEERHDVGRLTHAERHSFYLLAQKEEKESDDLSKGQKSYFTRLSEKKERLTHLIYRKNDRLARHTQWKEGSWNPLTLQEKSRLAEVRRKVNRVKSYKERAAEALRRALEWASTPEGKDAQKDPVEAFAEHAAALKISLLEAQKCKPIELSDKDLSPQAVNEALSRSS
ncbi:hypothetical protein BJ684DRAFT_15926 [Piptocephalis cylindrospora]|uniref:Uncharacterized protein n=1 Tax=Piptocephalis cylindrospora TaxID=1907219 RepID=A0A4P9Y4K7_9FUNG|nr:hypothetical protein BJ684DRAFT_15926 [Piptocephalis cylindrospora]|eukprot:RKP13704.1 hypothetical protein BJ684DRAFT_15926 [Piptocephalis cylindrospora]